MTIEIEDFIFSPSVMTVPPGSYRYVCSIHPHMKGVITVAPG